MFRSPTDDALQNERFYTEEYDQDFRTGIPSDEMLEKMILQGFAGSADYTDYVRALRDIGAGPTLFDFGCSWGYGSYQLNQAGFDVTAFEVSAPRARFAKDKLGVRTIANLDDWVDDNAGKVDVFFSAHVLEHVPSPSAAFRAARRVVKPGGLFVAYFPNGSAACRGLTSRWSHLWGEVHPNFLDDVFLNKMFITSPRMFASTPMTPSVRFSTPRYPPLPSESAALYVDDLSQIEMFFVARL